MAAVQLQDVHPPSEVIDAFKDVASAREDKNRFINEAEAYRNDILPKTRGEAAVIVNGAQAYKEAKVREAEGEADRFNSVLKEYRQAKDITRKRLYLETMEKVLSGEDLKKYLLSTEAQGRVLPFLPIGQGAAGAGGGSK